MKIIALDFDGTLIESNHIKDQAFETIFTDWPEHKEAMMQWHLARDTVDRHEKFRYFVEDVLGMHGNNKLINKLILKFTELTRQTIVDSKMVEGAKDFLEYFKGKVTMYLISATPQRELNAILKEKNLLNYFKSIYGAPINKVEILNTIVNDEKISRNDIIYIGDSSADQQAAEYLGIHFIGRKSDRKLNGVNSPVYSEFFKIKNHLDKNYDFNYSKKES